MAAKTDKKAPGSLPLNTAELSFAAIACAGSTAPRVCEVLKTIFGTTDPPTH